MAPKIVAIVGTYRKGRVIDTAVDEMLAGAVSAGAQTEKIMLLDRHIEFCTNCRDCTQQPGSQRGQCPLQDDLTGILDALDEADGIVLASPINFGNVTALMKRFIERLICYAYWPWDIKKAPKLRIQKPTRQAVLAVSSMCPAFPGRLLMANPLRTMKTAARCVGAGTIGTCYFGLTAVSRDETLSEKNRQKAFQMGRTLASA